MRTRTALAVLLVVALASLTLATGCDMLIRKGVEQATGVKVNEQEDEVSIETKDGSMSTSKGQVPKGFPDDVPLYKGAKVVTGIAIGNDTGKAYMVTLGTEDAPKAVAAWYKKELADAGWTISAAVDTPAGQTVQASGSDREVTVIVTSDEGAQPDSPDYAGKTAINITVSPKKK